MVSARVETVCTRNICCLSLDFGDILGRQTYPTLIVGLSAGALSMTLKLKLSDEALLTTGGSYGARQHGFASVRLRKRCVKYHSNSVI
jgi:hypothetical protein